MTDLNQSLKDSGNPQKYYAVIEHMADDDLDLFEYRLYGHYKRVCGQEGACWESVRTTAQKCGMSVGKVSQARRGLVEKGFISETVITKQSTAGKDYVVGIAVELVDRWLENAQRYSSSEQPVHEVNGGVHEVKQRKNHKKKNADSSQKSCEESVRAPTNKPKKQRPRNLVFDMVAHIAFDVPLGVGAIVGDRAGDRIGIILSEMKSSRGGVMPTPETIQQAWSWWHAKNPTMSAPRDAVKFDAMIREYEQHADPRRSATPDPAPSLSQAEKDRIRYEMFGGVPS